MAKNRSFQRFNQVQQSQPADIFEDVPSAEKELTEEQITDLQNIVIASQDRSDPVIYDEAGNSIGITGETGHVGVEGSIDEPDETDTVDDGVDPGDIGDDVGDTTDGVELTEEDYAGNEDGDDAIEPEEAEDDIEGTDTPLGYPFTDVTEWTKEELEAYISRPDGMDIYHSKLVQAIETHRRLSTELDRAWSVDECTDFFKSGIVPEKTQFGNYVKDVTRKLRRESEWTTAELESWAMGLIRPEGLVTTGGLAVELHTRFRMPINSLDPEMVIAHYKYNFGPNKNTAIVKVGEVPTVTAKEVAPEVKAQVEKKIKYAGLNEMNQSYIEEALKRYIDAVRPNKMVSEKDGFAAQRELNNVVQYILKLEDPAGVKSGLDILFSTIVAERLHNPRGVFTDTYAFRFAEGIPLEGKAQETHRRLFTLFFAFIDGDEAILSQTDVPELIKYLPARQQHLLLSYLRMS